MHTSNFTIPYLIPRSDFLKFSAHYQRRALKHEQTGKIRIVDNIEPYFLHAVASTEPVPPSGGSRYCAPSPAHGGLVAQEGVEGVPQKGAPRDGVQFGATLEGGSIMTPQRDGHQPVSLGYYRLIRNEPSEWKIEGVP